LPHNRYEIAEELLRIVMQSLRSCFETTS
jgi:hypothetical protein